MREPDDRPIRPILRGLGRTILIIAADAARREVLREAADRRRRLRNRLGRPSAAPGRARRALLGTATPGGRGPEIVAATAEILDEADPAPSPDVVGDLGREALARDPRTWLAAFRARWHGEPPGL